MERYVKVKELHCRKQFIEFRFNRHYYAHVLSSILKGGRKEEKLISGDKEHDAKFISLFKGFFPHSQSKGR